MTEAEKEAETEAIIRCQEENPDWWGEEREDEISLPLLTSIDDADLDELRANLRLTRAERLAKMEARLREHLASRHR